MAKFLFIEQNAARRKAITDLGLKSFPDDEFIVRTDRAEAMTAVAMCRGFIDGVVADGIFNSRGSGSLDFLAAILEQMPMPFVIYSSQAAEVINRSLERHGLVCPPDHRFDATQSDGLEKAIRFLKNNLPNQAVRPGSRAAAAHSPKR